MIFKNDQSVESIPLHRVAVVRPFVQFLEDIGAPAKRAFLRCGLPYNALGDVDNYVPSHRFREFLVAMTHSEGINDLGFRVGRQFGADNADPHMTEMLQHSPTLYSGLLKASQLVNRTISHCSLGVLQPRNSEFTYFCIQPSSNADDPVTEQFSWFGVMSLIEMARVYTGPQWDPTEIGVVTGHTPSLPVLERLPRTYIRPSQMYNYIAVENELLSLPPFVDRVAMQSSSSATYLSLPDNFTSSLERVVLSYVPSTKVSLEVAAELCNMSKRTMQRKLKDKGTRFSEIRDKALYRAAVRMLRDPAIKVADVANQLGYSDAAHFSRAFRRVAGISPREYRNL